MNTVLATLSDVVGFLAQSFKLAAVFPSFLFVFLNEVLILPCLPQQGVIQELTTLSVSGNLVVAAVFALLLGYTLAIVNIPLIRLFFVLSQTRQAIREHRLASANAQISCVKKPDIRLGLVERSLPVTHGGQIVLPGNARN